MSQSRSRWQAIGWLLLAALVVGSCLAALSTGRCGDGICDGPEDVNNCPQDCGSCASPNPRRAEVQDILEWRNRLIDGGFENESAMPDYTDDDRAGRPAGFVERSTDQGVRRTGEYGVVVETDQDGGVFALRAKIDKGETTRYSLWVKSLGEPTELEARVLGLTDFAVFEAVSLPQRNSEPVSVSVGTQWEEVQLAFPITTGLEYALFVIDIKPNTRLAIDDARIEVEHWRAPEVDGLSRAVGGIDVPMEPLAPIHFNVLIHIEDPKQLTTNEEYFREKTTVFTELARTLHEHGGFLTIQPEEDWPQAADIFSDGETLANLTAQYGVVYSTHTHGPKCIGCIVTEGNRRLPQGECLEAKRPLSNKDCEECRDCEDITTDTDPYTPIYVGNLRQLLDETSGTTISDHNGNWRYENLSALADVGIRTLSGFKDGGTQSTFQTLFTNPWRPTHSSAADDPDIFFMHDPSTRVIYIPGWGQAITRHPEYLHERLAAMLAQVILHADPERVNTFYIVTHVDHYKAEADVDYIEVDQRTGEVNFGEAFERDLGYWEDTLSELVEPLVAAGYLQWTSLPEIGELFVEWEESCASD